MEGNLNLGDCSFTGSMLGLYFASDGESRPWKSYMCFFDNTGVLQRALNEK